MTEENSQFDPQDSDPNSPKKIGEGFRVTVYKQAGRTAEEFVLDMVAALGCYMDEALALYRRSETKGHAVALIGSRDEAYHVATMLRQIGYKVVVEAV